MRVHHQRRALREMDLQIAPLPNGNHQWEIFGSQGCFVPQGLRIDAQSDQTSFALLRIKSCKAGQQRQPRDNQGTPTSGHGLGVPLRCDHGLCRSQILLEAPAHRSSLLSQLDAFWNALRRLLERRAEAAGTKPAQSLETDTAHVTRPQRRWTGLGRPGELRWSSRPEQGRMAGSLHR